MRLSSKQIIKQSPFYRTKAFSRRTQGGHYDNSGNFIRDGQSFLSERGECRVIQPTSHRNVPSDGCGTSVEAPDQETESPEATSEQANIGYLQEMMKFLADGGQLPEDLLEEYMEEWEKCDDVEKEELTRYFMELREGPPVTETGGTEDLGELKLPKNVKLRFGREEEDDDDSRRPFSEDLVSNEQVERDYRKLLGNISPEFLGAMCNAQDDADMMVTLDPKGGGIYVSVVDPQARYAADRRFFRKDGELYIANESFVINDELEDGSPNPLKGTGTEIFANQVLALKRAKAKEIITHAAGSKNSVVGFNGFVTWPRTGFKGRIPEDVFRKLGPALHRKMGKSREILDLYAIPGGKEAWYEHGKGIPMTFDLTDGSRNMKVLEAYLKERRERR